MTEKPRPVEIPTMELVLSCQLCNYTRPQQDEGRFFHETFNGDLVCAVCKPVNLNGKASRS